MFFSLKYFKKDLIQFSISSKERSEGWRGGAGEVEKEPKIPNSCCNSPEICQGKGAQSLHGMLCEESKGGQIALEYTCILTQHNFRVSKMFSTKRSRLYWTRIRRRTVPHAAHFCNSLIIFEKISEAENTQHIQYNFVSTVRSSSFYPNRVELQNTC